MSKACGLQKLSVEYLSVYRFSCKSTEYQDYLIKYELDERTKDFYYSAKYAVLRAHYLFLFSHDAARSCLQVINLQRCQVREFRPDRHWPGCCSAGCQIIPPGSAPISSSSLSPECWQLGFFPGSKWKSMLETYSRRSADQQSSAEDGPDDEYEMEECDNDTELNTLWATLADLDPAQLSSVSTRESRRSAVGGGGGDGSGGSTCSGGSVAAAAAALSAKLDLRQSASMSAPPPRSPKPVLGSPAAASAPPAPPIRTTPISGGSSRSFQPKPPSLLDAASPPLPHPMIPQTSASTSQLKSPSALEQVQQSPLKGKQSPIIPPKDQPQPQPSPRTKQQPTIPPKDSPQPPISQKDAAQPPIPPKDSPQPPIPPKDSPQPPIPPKDLPQPQPPLRNQQPQIPPKDLAQPPIPPKGLQQSPPQPEPSAATDLYEMLQSGGRFIDALCSYYRFGYYGQESMTQARQLMKRATDDGSYMLRGFCNRQAGQEKTLCIKFDMVYKFNIMVSSGSYQISNKHNDIVHPSMEALLFYHHIHPIKVAQQLQHDFILNKPYNFEAMPGAPTKHITYPLSAALWNHGSKELCAEVLKNSAEGTYALRADPESPSVVLCVMHRSQILKFRIIVTKTETQEREFALNHAPGMPRFYSLEDFIVYHHKHPIRGNLSEGDIYLKMPFQLVLRCQQELDFQQLTVDSIFTSDSLEVARTKVGRGRGGNFLLRRGSPSTDDGGATTTTHSLIVRDDTGIVKVFFITERDTDLSFRPQKIFTLEEKPELSTDRIEKMIHFLCISLRFLSPDIVNLVKP